VRLVIVTNIVAPYRVPLFNELAARPGLDLTVLFAAATEVDREWDRPEGIRFDYKIGCAASLPKRGGGVVYIAPNMIREIVRLRPTVVIAGGAVLGYQAWLGARLIGSRFFTWSEATEVSERAWTPTWRWPAKALLARRADGCIAASSATARYFERLGVRSHRIHLSLLSVDTAALGEHVDDARGQRASLRDELGVSGTAILYVGRLEEHKGVDLLFDAFLRARRAGGDLHLLFVGSGSLRPRLEERASVLAPGRVTFVGFQQPEDLPRFYAAGDVFCLFSRQEAFGAVLAEALAAGLPVVASHAAGATADLVVDGVNGWAVDPAASEKCAAVLLKLARDAALRQRMGAASRVRAGLCSPVAAADSMLTALGWPLDASSSSSRSRRRCRASP
jgi:glycosyltransferase involved in cell wall biosynthesis